MVVHKVRCDVRIKTGRVANLVLSDDFARRDLFREVVSMVGYQAVEALAVKFSLLHPNFLLAAGAEFKVHALMQGVTAVREETEAPRTLFLAGEGGVADVDVS